MPRPLEFWRSETGASAAEFAMVVPAFFALTLGLVNLCFMLYFNVNLHFAVDDAARCMSVNPVNVTNSCSSPALTQTHAGANFSYPTLSPSFTAVTAACGSKVTGTATYKLNAIVVSKSVPLSATACFPLQG
jgi:Flp pilus assembly protein TadG